VAGVLVTLAVLLVALVLLDLAGWVVLAFHSPSR
jgi:hypothetical protein